MDVRWMNYLKSIKQLKTFNKQKLIKRENLLFIREQFNN